MERLVINNLIKMSSMLSNTCSEGSRGATSIGFPTQWANYQIDDVIRGARGFSCFNGGFVKSKRLLSCNHLAARTVAWMASTGFSKAFAEGKVLNSRNSTSDATTCLLHKLKQTVFTTLIDLGVSVGSAGNSDLRWSVRSIPRTLLAMLSIIDLGYPAVWKQTLSSSILFFRRVSSLMMRRKRRNWENTIST